MLAYGTRGIRAGSPAIAVTYRMLGSLSEADDALQEAWLRLSRSDTSGVDNLGGWLTTVVARVAFVLHDMFAVPFDEIAPIVSRSPTAAKMLASRGRRRVRGAGTVPDADLARQRAETFSGRARFARPALVDGAVGAVFAPGGRPRFVFGFTITRGKIVGIDVLADPERLRQLDLAVLDD
jgi:hypothetical protein